MIIQFKYFDKNIIFFFVKIKTCFISIIFLKWIKKWIGTANNSMFFGCMFLSCLLSCCLLSFFGMDSLLIHCFLWGCGFFSFCFFLGFLFNLFFFDWGSNYGFDLNSFLFSLFSDFLSSFLWGGLFSVGCFAFSLCFSHLFLIIKLKKLS